MEMLIQNVVTLKSNLLNSSTARTRRDFVNFALRITCYCVITSESHFWRIIREPSERLVRNREEFLSLSCRSSLSSAKFPRNYARYMHRWYLECAITVLPRRLSVKVTRRSHSVSSFGCTVVEHGCDFLFFSLSLFFSNGSHAVPQHARRESAVPERANANRGTLKKIQQSNTLDSVLRKQHLTSTEELRWERESINRWWVASEPPKFLNSWNFEISSGEQTALTPSIGR